MPQNIRSIAVSQTDLGEGDLERVAIRTAFIARFIVLREGKRTKAHRKIERMRWDDSESARDLALAFKWAFTENGDRSEPVDRDIRRALLHAERSHKFFRNEYNKRSTYSFIDALLDYERSNVLLFGSTVGKRPGGWRSARELVDNNSEAPISVFEILQSAGSLLTQTFASDLTKIDDDDEDESE